MLLFSRYKISGHSMEPKIKNGDYVIAINLLFIFKKIKVNDVIVFKKFGKYFVKKIAKITNGRYFVVGENINDSLDSRKFGLILPEDVLGKVIFKY